MCQSREEGEARQEGAVGAADKCIKITFGGDPDALIRSERICQRESEKPTQVTIPPVGIGGVGPTKTAGDDLVGVGNIGADDECTEVPVAIADVSQGFGSCDRQNGTSHQNKF